MPIGDVYKVSREPILVKTYKDGSKRYRSNACPKCGGVGYLYGYEHIDGARCWKCGASGYYPHEWTEPSDERIEKQKAKEKEKLIAQADEKNAYFMTSHGFNDDGKTYLVLGDTYAIKDDLKSLGAKFDYLMGWKLPKDTDKYPTVEITIDEVTDKDENGWLVYNPNMEIEEVVKKKKQAYADSHKSEEDKDKNIKMSDYLGNVGEKITVTAKLIKEYTYDTNYGYYGGTSTIYTFEDDNGNKILWTTSSMPYVNDKPIESGKTYTITGTVKEHKEYKGEKETVLTRCKLTAATNESVDVDNKEFDPNGHYTEDGVFVPKHDPITGLPLIPKDIWDMWD